MNITGKYDDSILSRMVVKEIYLSTGRVGSMMLIILLSLFYLILFRDCRNISSYITYSHNKKSK